MYKESYNDIKLVLGGWEGQIVPHLSEKTTFKESRLIRIKGKNILR